MTGAGRGPLLLVLGLGKVKPPTRCPGLCSPPSPPSPGVVREGRCYLSCAVFICPQGHLVPITSSTKRVLRTYPLEISLPALDFHHFTPTHLDPLTLLYTHRNIASTNPSQLLPSLLQLFSLAFITLCPSERKVHWLFKVMRSTAQKQ